MRWRSHKSCESGIVKQKNQKRKGPEDFQRQTIVRSLGLRPTPNACPHICNQIDAMMPPAGILCPTPLQDRDRQVMQTRGAYKANAPSATRPMRPTKAEVRAAPPVEASTAPVASASELRVEEAPERVEVEVVMEEVPLLWWVADEAAAAAAVVELEPVLVAEESVSVSVALPELELLVAEAEAEEEESVTLGAALLVLSITKGGV